MLHYVIAIVLALSCIFMGLIAVSLQDAFFAMLSALFASATVLYSWQMNLIQDVKVYMQSRRMSQQ